MCGLDVPDFVLIEFQGAKTFVTRNFIEKRERSKNLAHLYTYFSMDSDYDVETILGIIERESKQFKDLDTFVKMCLFDSLIGNHDRHGRNIAFIVSSGGSVLAPIYDNTSALGLETQDFLGADFNPTGAILTKETTPAYGPTISDYVKDFRRLEFEDSVSEFINQLDLPSILKIIEEGTYSDRMKSALKRLVEKRYKELMDAR